jgi:hypothetical protein
VGGKFTFTLDGREHLKTKTQIRGKFVKWRVWSGFKWLRIDYYEHDNGPSRYIKGEKFM